MANENGAYWWGSVINSVSEAASTWINASEPPNERVEPKPIAIVESSSSEEPSDDDQEQVELFRDVEKAPGAFVLWTSKGERIGARVQALVRAAGDRHGLVLAQKSVTDRLEDDVLEQIKGAEFFVPVITRDFVMDADAGLLDIVVAILHHGPSRTIPIVMDGSRLDRKNWGKVLPKYIETEVFLWCLKDDGIDDASDELARFMENLRQSKGANRIGVLKGVDHRPHHELVKLKAKDRWGTTRQYIFDHMRKKWIGKDLWSQVFVLLGPEGVGKSVALASLCEMGHLFEPKVVYQSLTESNTKIMKQSTPFTLKTSIGKRLSSTFRASKKRSSDGFMVVACHFFDESDCESLSGKKCILSLVAQMSETIPQFFRCSEYYDEEIVSTLDLKSLFRRLIVNPLAQMEAKGLSPCRRGLVILDALDACEEHDQKQIWEIVHTEWRGPIPEWLGVCVSSTKDKYVLPKIEIYKPTVFDMAKKNNDDELRKILEDRGLGNVSLKTAKGKFLPVRFIDYERQLRRRKHHDRWKRDFSLGPKEIYKRYFRRLLRRTFKGDTRKYETLLGPMCVSREPLSIDFVSKLLNLTPGRAAGMFVKNKHLFVLSDDTVRFAHYSMVVFLQHAKDKSISIDLGRAKATMARICEKHCLDCSFAAKQFVVHCKSKFVFGVLHDFEKLHQVLVDFKVPVKKFLSDLKAYHDMDLVVLALEKSFNALKHDPRQLASQLLGRFRDKNHPLIRSIPSKLAYSWLSPVVPCLESVDDPLQMSFPGHEASILGVAIQGDLVVTAGEDGTVKIWSRDLLGECIRTSDMSSIPVWSVVIYDELIITASMSIHIWSKNGVCLSVLEGHEGPIYGLAVDKGVIVTGSQDSTVKCWSLDKKKCMKTFKGHKNPVAAVAVQGDIVASASGTSVLVFKMDAKDDSAFETLDQHLAQVSSLVIMKEAVLISSTEDGELYFWSLKKGYDLIRKLEVCSGPIFGLCVDGDNTIACAGDRKIHLLSMDGNTLKTFRGPEQDILCVAMENGILVSGSMDKQVRIHDTKQPEPTSESSERHKDWVHDVVIFNEMVISASRDTTIKIWSLDDSSCVLTMNGHNETVWTVAARDEFIISGSEDRTVRVWDINSGQCTRVLQGHTDTVLSVEFDGETIISKSPKETITWSLETYEKKSSFEAKFTPQDPERSLLHQRAVTLPQTEVGFTLDSPIYTYTLSKTHFVCFDENHCINILNIID